MRTTEILCTIIIVLLIIILYFIWRTIKIKKNLNNIYSILNEIEQGNMDRRIVAQNNDKTADICYKINEIVLNNKEQLIKLKKANKAYKQLMTSLSHDVRTPLTSLVGYLDAIHNRIVTGEEKDDYIEIARDKAYNLKDYVDILFEWLKLDSKERIFHFENTDINELSRSIIVHWIPQLENKHFLYDITIPEDELLINLDASAYTRILDNLIQNVINHSKGNHVGIKVASEDKSAVISISDNGRGIPKRDLPYVFERLYKCDESRSAKGNGLGLSIVQELVKAHNGNIYVSSIPNSLTTFTVILPVAL